MEANSAVPAMDGSLSPFYTAGDSICLIIAQLVFDVLTFLPVFALLKWTEVIKFNDVNICLLTIFYKNQDNIILI